MSNARIFISFDTEHDGDLYELLLEQSQSAGSGFTVSGRTERTANTDLSNERARRRICESDQLIVICGENTDSSVRVSVELGIAEQEGTPHFLLWGRREAMCTKPVGAKPAEGMFSWTRQILLEQIAFTRRKARSDAEAESVRAERLKARENASGVTP